MYLGVLSGREAKYIVWFGIASALGAPVGLSLLGYVLRRSDDDLIQRLAKVPEIERLVAEAETREEKVRVLEAQRAQLAEVIRLESRRQAALDRIDSLERDGLRIVQELDSLTEELRVLGHTAEKSIAHDEIERLRERVRARNRGDVVLRLGSRVYYVNREIIKALPFGVGSLTLAYFRVLDEFSERLRSRRKVESDSPSRSSTVGPS